jgi:hypothetical protein
VTRGETFKIKIDVFNYLDTAQTVELSFEGAGSPSVVSAAELSHSACERCDDRVLRRQADRDRRP